MPTWGALIIVMLPALAQAAATAELRYQAPAHRHCPSASELAAAVAARMGYSPFADGAERIVTATIAASGKDLSGKISLTDRDGTSRGARTLSGAGDDCVELASSLTLAIALAIDPLVMQRAPATVPVVAPAPPPPTPVVVSTPRQIVPVVSPAPRPSVRLGAAVLIAFGSAPDVVPGFEIEAGLQWQHFSLSLAGHVDVPDTTSLIQTELLYGALTPCLHFGVGTVCGRVIVGALRGAGTQIADPRRDTTFYAAAGLRGGVEAPIYRQLYLGVFIDLTAVLTRTTISVSDTPVWSTPLLHGDLGVQTLVLF